MGKLYLYLLQQVAAVQTAKGHITATTYRITLAHARYSLQIPEYQSWVVMLERQQESVVRSGWQYHGLRGSASPVLTATGFVNGRWQFSTPTE